MDPMLQRYGLTGALRAKMQDCCRIGKIGVRFGVRFGSANLQTSVAEAVGNGANGQNRTDDPRFTKALLYRLSYVGVRR